MHTFIIEVLSLTLFFALAEGGGSRSPCAHLSRSPNSRKYTESVNRNRRASSCDGSETYRTPDGSCNNVKNRLWGAAGVPLRRTLTPVYADGVGTPRTLAVSGAPLPHPRVISNHVHFEKSFLSNKNTIMVMQWGQFIDHDITGTPVMTDGDEDIDCCTWPDSVQSNKDSPCNPIHIEAGDPFFPEGKCMNSVRSQAASGTGTNSSNPRQQYNELSAFIDGSHIYGISTTETDDLRNKTSGAGLMKVSDGNLLPKGDDSDCFLNTSDSNSFCFKAGDSRVNVVPGLSLLHTLFLREHNRVAGVLKTIQPLWNDETLFQEARKIVIAELQVITYDEWLPEILGKDGMSKYNLNLGNYNYNESLDPSLSNVFSTAAFRFGHSMVPENFTIGSKVVDTGDLFKRTNFLINNLNDVVGSLLEAPGERADAWYVDGMRDRMFEEDPAAKDGLDIVSLNIQRGREHGLRSYNEWREYCGLTKINSFTNGTDFGGIQAQDLKDIYESVDDIDLYSGGISEVPNLPAAVGKTYMCLIGEQFRKLRDGDRFWFESTDSVTGFTASQIDQLKKASLSRIICDNADSFQTIQPRAFSLPLTNATEGNTIRSCDQVKKVNIRRFWKS
ncbi:peroxidase-like [Haliotis asinina]|uniref:peroxidase-like n=1 Tax=Haliotis asinina TaxID=109174 RepID=UPI003531D7FE